MVFQKRLDYGFSGYQVPPTPRAPRSARKRASFKKKVDESQICVFDLLATIAGKILVEGEKSVGVDCCENGEVTQKELPLFDTALKLEPTDSTYQPSYKSTNNLSEVHNPEPALKLSSPRGINSWPALENSDSSIKAFSNLDCPSKIEMAHFQSNTLIEPEVAEYIKSELSDVVKPAVGVGAAIYDFKVRNLEPSLHSVSATKLPAFGDHAVHGTCNVKILNRDDAEKSSGCTYPSTLTKPYRSLPPRIVDRRIKKFLACKYWNVSPKQKDGEKHNTGVDKQPVYQNQRCFRRQRSQRNYPFKKRKMYCHGPSSNSNGVVNKNMNHEAFLSVVGTSSSIMGRNTSFNRRDSHVKLRIKSFRIPELFLEISEMATVGSLKRTVMEAMTAILGGGLHVGVLLNGKKIADDNKTLLQTGISHDNQLDSVGFSLEPNNSQNPPQSLPSGNSSHILSAKTPQPLARYMPQEVDQGSSDMLLDPPLASSGNFTESDHDSVPSPNLSVNTFAGNCRAVVPVPAMKMEVVPAPTPLQSNRSKHSEAAQRRIRRPFSVSEVEALVQAVEKLGTGRWRDVKLQAFENAKHRTYVDLKDKWKTLVHTARISPQQRRGEPVPQELLDRVLDAHSHWSLQQAKQQLKHQRETQLLLELEPSAASAHNRN